MTNDLTNAQKLVLKNWIVANNGGAFDGTAVAALNAPASPTFFVYRSSVPIDEIMSNGFDWTRVDNAASNKWRIWEAMTALGTINPSRVNIRAGINEAWPLAANDAHRLAIFGHCQRAATVGERLLASGAGTTVSNAGVGPGTCGPNAEGNVTLQIVIASEAAA